MSLNKSSIYEFHSRNRYKTFLVNKENSSNLSNKNLPLNRSVLEDSRSYHTHNSREFGREITNSASLSQFKTMFRN